MDAEVLAALVRWPNVPAVYGWLAIDARGNFRLRGESIGNAALRAFIGRNYAADPAGCWHFQNGPQRVYVAIELAPLICRLGPDGSDEALTTHVGQAVTSCERALVDEVGTIYLATDRGPAAIDDRDGVALLARLVGPDGRALTDDAIESWLRGERRAAVRVPGPDAAPVAIERVRRDAVAGLLGFDPAPRASSGHPAC
jgi:hypothetical protein